MIKKIKNIILKLICKIRVHKWSGTKMWYGINNVPYDWRECERCEHEDVIKIYNKELEEKRIQSLKNKKIKMSSIEIYITNLRIKWLKQDLMDKHSYYPKEKIKKWIEELQEKIKTNEKRKK